MKIILVMGLPGAGKTTLADEMAPLLKAKRLSSISINHFTIDGAYHEILQEKDSFYQEAIKHVNDHIRKHL